MNSNPAFRISCNGNLPKLRYERRCAPAKEFDVCGTVAASAAAMLGVSIASAKTFINCYNAENFTRQNHSVLILRPMKILLIQI